MVESMKYRAKPCVCAWVQMKIADAENNAAKAEKQRAFAMRQKTQRNIKRRGHGALAVAANRPCVAAPAARAETCPDRKRSRDRRRRGRSALQ